MPVLVDGVVVQPPPPSAPPPIAHVFARTGMRSIWTVGDSEWDMTSVATGVMLLPGVRGWNMPPIDAYTSQSPSVAGAINRGNRTSVRPVEWPVLVYSDGSNLDWIILDNAFWSTMNPNQTGTWSMVQPTGKVRSIDLRYTSDDGGGDDDPIAAGWTVYGINLTAEQPYWREEPVIRTFHAGTPVPFFSGPGIVQINSASQFATATIDNPGDVAGYVVWTLSGPFDSASVGTAGKKINVPFALGAGEFLSIYTQPEFMLAVDGAGVDRTDDLGSAVMGSPSAIQPSAAAPLSLSMISPGEGAFIEASLTPYFYRAW